MTTKKPYEHLNDAEEVLSKVDPDMLDNTGKLAWVEAKVSLAYAQMIGSQRR